MPTVAATKIPAAIEDLQEGGNAGTDQWAIALTNTVPPSKTFTAGTTDLATGGGYTQGGNNVATNSAGMNGNDYVVVLADPATWTGTGGGFTARYALLVNKTLNIVLQYWDYGSSQVVAAGEQFVVDLSQVATEGAYKVS